MVTVQVVPEAPAQSPPQTVAEEAEGAAVRVTDWPTAKGALQAAPQVMPGGLEVTSPPVPVPAVLVRVSV
jgi:hypothetical protein